MLSELTSRQTISHMGESMNADNYLLYLVLTIIGCAIAFMAGSWICDRLAEDDRDDSF